MEDSFSMNGGADCSGGNASDGGDGSGSNGSDGEQQMKLHSLAHRSPPAVWPSSPGVGDACVRVFGFCFFFYFWLHWVFIAACRLSLVAASRGYSSLRCTGFSLQWLLLLQSTGSRHTGFSSCGTQAQ